ncbi:radical SAM family heme chaperone HemW [Psychrobium sp. 1_MG-2023]|uniref:radical SAM family heme chaperone HemW n=1 Tax=Psychrobium sp. 1_MG-2023 TaxID=3062624 RepID=UPI000C342671|nr:radical SAM family heme chaperone HemW [Psychrobium sp. 1_MG-2023]MDP2562367.1 radical SAM family heme chaperone HemW [Psychrobium sp. 1_MG-2023]PKF55867.1 YggW family oxidoreductase [Alteromonadales bacterium alter-6D02]
MTHSSTVTNTLSLPPLSLYIHIPWCVQKCPYCDFNSHAQKGEIPHVQYVDALLEDLANDLHWVQGRTLQSIFIGGGTPSLLDPKQMKRLLDQVKRLIPCRDDLEVTMEANPGTVESGKFALFQQAGVNRISIGVQSFQEDKLTILGRIHDHNEAINAAKQANTLGLKSFNIDLMHSLPQQNVSDALVDLNQAIALNPPHLSWYQLTIEPNTQFHSKPPTIPDDDTLADIYEAGKQALTDAGYQQYEISAFSKPDYQCFHNLNYWRFGDYLGIGCGAHSKVTCLKTNSIVRHEKIKHPKGYLDCENQYIFRQWSTADEDLPLEFFMNRFRLTEPCPRQDFIDYTGLNESIIRVQLEQAITKGLIEQSSTHWQVTPLGQRFLNELLNIFM